MPHSAQQCARIYCRIYCHVDIIVFQPGGEGNNDAVSRTLDFGFADFSTAQAFRELAKNPKFAAQQKDLNDRVSLLLLLLLLLMMAMFWYYTGGGIRKSIQQSIPIIV